MTLHYATGERPSYFGMGSRMGHPAADESGEPFDQVRHAGVATIASRSCSASPATVKPGGTRSTRIRSLIEFFVRRGKIFWYSSDRYHLSAWAMLGNSIRTAEPGHVPSTTFTSPIASHLPPYVCVVASTCSR